MLKWLAKNKNKIMCPLLALSICFGVMFSGFESYGASLDTTVIQMPYNEPPTSETQGYFTMLLKDSDGAFQTITYFWSAYCVDETTGNYESIVDIAVNETSQSVSFTFSTYAGLNIHYYLYAITQTGYIVNRGNGISTVNGTITDTEYVMWVDSGYTLVTYTYGGNVSNVNWSYSNVEYTFLWGSDNVEYYYMYQMLNRLNALGNQNYSAYNTMISRLNDILTMSRNILVQLDNVYELALEYLPSIDTELDNITQLLTEINDYIKSDEFSEKMEEFESSTQSQSDKINDLNAQNKTDKTDINSASSTVDGYIDVDGITNFGVVLSTFTTNEYILQMIMIVFAVGLISYVLFGKR